MSEFHLVSKLAIPGSREGTVERRQLVRSILEAPAVSALLVHAPPGFGKTVVMGQVARRMREEGIAVGWVSFDDSDGDITRFLSYFQLALLEAAGEGDDSRTRARRELGGDTDTIVSRCVNLMLSTSRRLAIFLDDFHTVARPEIEGFLQRLIAVLPAGKQIIIGSRVFPGIGLQRLQLSGRGLIISAEELRFRFIETREFFGSRFDLSDDDIRELQQRTDGWPAAMQFLLLSFSKRSDRRSYSRTFSMLTPELVDYLAADVFLLQAPEVREFLLRTSVLSSMNGPLCDAVTGGSQSEELLERLEREGLFLERTAQTPAWYHYHSLFREFLQRELRRMDSAEVVACQLSAARWLEQAKLFEDALSHYAAAGELDALVRIIVPNIENLVYEERLGMVIKWVELLPHAVLEAHPAIQGPALIAYAYQRQYSKANAILALRRKCLDVGDPVQRNQYGNLELFLLSAQDRMEEMGHIARDGLDSVPSHMPFEHGIHLNAYAYWLCASNRFEEAHSALLQAQAAHEQAGDLFGRAYQEAIDGTIAMAQGDLSLALERYAAGMRNAESRLPPGSSCGAYLAAHWGEALYELNDLPRAQKLLEDYLPLIDKNCLVDAVICGHVTLSHIALAAGRHDEAVRQLEELLVLGHRYHWPRMVREGLWQTLRVWTLLGNRERADHAFSQIEAAGGTEAAGGIDHHSGDLEARGAAHGRYLILCGEYGRARTMLRAAIMQAEKVGRRRRLMKLRILNALAISAVGEQDAALRELGQALRIGAKGGFVRSFVDEGPALWALLRDVYKAIQIESISHVSDNFIPYVRSLLEAAGLDVEAGDTAIDRPLKILTDKELEILLLLRAGKSNKALARHLSVSDNTIKWHLRNVYEKLGVNNRTQAVSAGRTFGLIS